MTKAQKRARLAAIVEALKVLYPEAECALKWQGDPWRLLVMGRLSAQCTDARVNEVCEVLFAKYPTAEALSTAPLCEIEDIVRPCGLFRSKAKNIRDASEILVKEHGGVLPDTMEGLLALPGVGRKIANLLLGDVYGKGGVVTDTHCIRICGRLGMYPTRLCDPYRVEMILADLICPEEASDFCHRIVTFGREVCRARSPLCDACPLGQAGLCETRSKEVARLG